MAGPNWQLQLAARKYWILGTLILLLGLVMYKLILSPYVSTFLSLQDELTSQRELLNSKSIRAQAITMLEKVQKEYNDVLTDINHHFYSESEADVLAKTLPEIISDYRNKIILLKPKSRPEEQSRSSILMQNIRGMNLENEAKIIDLIASGSGQIDANENVSELKKDLIRMIPEDKKDYVQMIWQQAPSNRLALLRIEKRETEIVIQGPYQGIMDLLTYFASTGKVIEISGLVLSETDVPNAIQTTMVIQYYVYY